MRTDPADPVRTDAEATVLAQLETMLHDAESTGRPEGLQRLHDSALSSAEVRPHVTLLVECALQELRSRSRSAVESAAVWEELQARADTALPGDDSTALRIRAQRTRSVRRCGRAADLGSAVWLALADWMCADGLFGPDDFRTATARQQLAISLCDRALGDDLLRARRMLAEEVRSRTECLGSEHPFTWTAQHDLAWVLVRLAEGSSQPDQGAIAAEQLSQRVAASRGERFGAGDVGALSAQLLHAHALILLGRSVTAADEIRYVLAVARRALVPLEPGLAERLLALAQAVAAHPAALRTAQCALQISAACYPADSRPVREALRLVDQLVQPD